MAKGFSLELEDYCSYCGDFEPEVEKTDVTAFIDAATRYMSTIKCKNAYKCSRIKANMEKRL